jgi:hypothetical protein
MNIKKRRALLGLTAFAALALGGCANLVGPRDVPLPASKLQASLERRFPIDRTVLALFEVTLTRPRVQLQPEADRVRVSMDASMAPRFGGARWNGALTLSGHLQLDNARHEVQLHDPRVEEFYLDRLDSQAQRQLARVATVLLDQAVRDLAVYQFRPDDLRVAGVQFEPTRIVTRADAVVVTLDPVR